MSIALPSVLQPGAINDTISQLRVINDRLQNFFGGGAAPGQQSGRYFAWDIFNEVREVATGRAPGTAPGRVAPSPVGNVQGVFPRIHDSIPLLYEQIHNLRRIGTLETDLGGKTYIAGQLQRQKQKYINHKEMQFAGMIRGSYFYNRVGDDLIPSLTSGNVTIDFQVPAGNKASLDMLGAGNIITALWTNVNTDIPFQLAKINEAFEQLVGRPLAHVWIDGPTFQNVLNNTKVQALSGTANVVFNSDVRDPLTNDRQVTLKGIPWLTWHITDGGLSFAGTFTKLIPTNKAVFCPTPDPSWIGYLEGSEIVIEYPGATPTERFGMYFYAEPTTKPAGYELIGVHNGIPKLEVPSCLAIGTIG